MPSVDTKKRNTLKTFASAGVTLAAGTAGITSIAEAAMSQSNAVGGELGVNAADLSITLFSSESVVEDTLILRNNTDAIMSFDRFIGGSIVFDQKRLNLNDEVLTETIVLEPGQQHSVQVSVLPLDESNIMEYVWATHHTSRVGKHAVVVELGGYLVDSSVVVFAPKILENKKHIAA